jgi:NAD(P)H-hydrate repair Nnr-like enzyme with NAD(P)H-hydrate epimerase domain
MRILTSDEVRQAAREAISRPDMSARGLMQRAGYAVAQFCVSNFKFKSVCVVCGQGNNGADGRGELVRRRKFIRAAKLLKSTGGEFSESSR